MKYHFVVNGYTFDICRQMEEQAGFAQKYLADMEEGEAIIYCRSLENIQKLNVHHTNDATLLLASEYIPEIILDTLCIQVDSSDLYIFENDDCGTELAVRMAARLSGSSVTEAKSMKLPFIVSKMTYANHMEAVFEMKRGPYCLSLAKGGERKELFSDSFTIKKQIICEEKEGHIVSRKFFGEDTTKGLENAKVILAAGRGVKNKENMIVIDETAKCLNAEVGVSRPAAMNAWKPMNQLIGVSGALTSPDICITAGVSGAAAFYAGIEKSRFIAAINTDEKAPIMKMADVAIVDDFLPIMEELKNICK